MNLKCARYDGDREMEFRAPCLRTPISVPRSHLGVNVQTLGILFFIALLSLSLGLNSPTALTPPDSPVSPAPGHMPLQHAATPAQINKQKLSPRVT